MQNCYSEYFETYCLYELHMIFFCHFNISYSIMHQHVGPCHDVSYSNIISYSHEVTEIGEFKKQ